MPTQAERRNTYVKDGIEYAKPNSKTKYEKYGHPKPNIAGAVDVDRVKKISENLADFIIKYIRDYKVEKVLNESGHVIGNKVVRQAPYAALVAFKDNDSLLIGWSKRHSGKAYQTDIKIIPEKMFNANSLASDLTKSIKRVDVEPLPFTKKDAVSVAINRAYGDKIIFTGGKNTVIRTSSGNFVPKCIERALPSFIRRAETYFKTTAKNVETKGANSNEKQTNRSAE